MIDICMYKDSDDYQRWINIVWCLHFEHKCLSHVHYLPQACHRGQCLVTSEQMRPMYPIASVLKSRSPSNFLYKLTACRQTKWSTRTTICNLLGRLKTIIFFDVHGNLVNVKETVQQCHSIDHVKSTLVNFLDKSGHQKLPKWQVALNGKQHTKCLTLISWKDIQNQFQSIKAAKRQCTIRHN